MTNEDWLGYIYSDDKCVNFVPQKVQNLVIRDFLDKMNEKYLLSSTEYNFENSYVTLKTILQNRSVERIVFYSASLFPSRTSSYYDDIRKRISEGSLKLAFALEENLISDISEFDDFFAMQLMKEFTSASSCNDDDKLVRFRDLRVFDRGLRKKYLQKINNIFDHGKIVEGEELLSFESKFSKKIGTNYSLGLSSGTDALFLALKSLGVGKGDQVLLPCMSWISTAHAVSLSGAEPVFIDIKDDLTICEKSLQSHINSKVKAIIVVHFMGHMCAMDEILSISKKNNIKVVEDCAQSFGADLNGVMAGNLSDISCFSFNAMKGLSSFGEAGGICTNDQELYEKVKSLRYCGYNNGTISEISLNYRLDTLQASLIEVNLDDLDRKQRKLEMVYNYYAKKLSSDFDIVYGHDDKFGSRHGFVIKVKNRELYIERLDQAKIETRVHHVPLMNEYEFYRDCISSMTNAEKIKDVILNLPFHEKLDFEQLEYVTSTLLSIKGSIDRG